jgi:hypothetical protein
LVHALTVECDGPLGAGEASVEVRHQRLRQTAAAGDLRHRGGSVARGLERGGKALGVCLQKAPVETAVNALHKLEPVVPAIKDMGARHAGYGVSDEDYGKVDDALLWTLHKGLGDEFTPEVEDAWIIAYTTSADTMKAGAVEQAA